MFFEHLSMDNPSSVMGLKLCSVLLEKHEQVFSLLSDAGKIKRNKRKDRKEKYSKERVCRCINDYSGESLQGPIILNCGQNNKQ